MQYQHVFEVAFTFTSENILNNIRSLKEFLDISTILTYNYNCKFLETAGMECFKVFFKLRIK